VLDDIIFEKDRELVNENIRRLTEDDIKTATVVCRAKRKDGTIIDIEVQSSRAVSNGKLAIIGTFLDITERKNGSGTR
jgi:PAS domain S-box-containing protein